VVTGVPVITPVKLPPPVFALSGESLLAFDLFLRETGIAILKKGTKPTKEKRLLATKYVLVITKRNRNFEFFDEAQKQQSELTM
jgi:hypothetical protein